MKTWEQTEKENSKKISKAKIDLKSTSLGQKYTLEVGDLIGKKIVNIGFIKGCDIEGGLAIDYRVKGGVKRCVLGFTELGMWIEWHGEIKEQK